MTEQNSLRSFYVIFLGQAFSLFGSRLVRFSLVWWITQESGKASTLALASIIALLPQVFLGPFAGALVDRWNRKRVMVIADTVIALVIIALAILFKSGMIQIWHIYVAMFIGSLGGAFHWPAMQASTTLMVPKEQYSRVAGFNQSLQGLANIISPPLGAFLFEILPLESIMMIDVTTAALAIVTLVIVAIPQPKRLDDSIITMRTILSDMLEGARFVWKWKGLRMIMGLSMVLNFLISPAFSLLPLVVTNHYKGGAIELAWLQSSTGIGMILGGLILGVWGKFGKKIVTAMYAVSFSGVMILLFSFLPPNMYLISVACMFAFSVLNSIANGLFLASMQAIIPPEIQGRVLSMLLSLATGMSPLGLAIAGPISDVFGIRIWFVIGGVAFILMGAGAFLSPTIMNIEEEKQEAKT